MIASLVKALLEVIANVIVQLLSRPKYEAGKDPPTFLKENLAPPKLPDVVSKYDVVFDQDDGN